MLQDVIEGYGFVVTMVQSAKVLDSIEYGLNRYNEFCVERALKLEITWESEMQVNCEAI
jgi:hypothetical protein